MGEAKKEKGAKVVEMKTDTTVEKKTYEQLEAENMQIKQQAEAMYRQMQQMNMQNIFKRLDYLFEVVKEKTAFPKDFVDRSTNEIVSLLTIPEEQKKEETKNDEA